MYLFKKKVENKNVIIEIFVCFIGKFNVFLKKNVIFFNENFKKNMVILLSGCYVYCWYMLMLFKILD